MDNFPRRSDIDQNAPSELAIREAIQKVEELGAHPALTDVVVRLDAALQRLANYIDHSAVDA